MANKPVTRTLAAVMGSVSAATLLLSTLTGFEGKRNVGYRDIAGIPTACMGDTADVVVGRYYSDTECQRRLEQQAIAHVDEVKPCFPGAAGNQLVAFGSFAYSFGSPAACGSTASRRWKAGDRRGACDALLAWNKARVNGRLVPIRGLTNRRQAERAICLKDIAS